MCISGRPILGIETSCDETAAAVVADGHIYSNAIFSQTEHSPLRRCGARVGVSQPHTNTPARRGSGTFRSRPETERSMWYRCDTRPRLGRLLAGGHFHSQRACTRFGPASCGVCITSKDISLRAVWRIPTSLPPFMALVASGGHTELIYVHTWGEYEYWGRTRDDAAGEAFDKVAKILDLLREGEVTMGGPRISMLAEEGDPHAFDFPRALINDPGFDFSFSGLKTSVLYRVRDLAVADMETIRADIAASFQAAVVDVLVDKTLKAAQKAGAERVLLSGGVAANRMLRSELDDGASKLGMDVFYPPTPLCTDNAAMIASAGAFRLARGEVAKGNLNASPRLPLPGLRERQA